jgi:hypothetical protein
MMVIVDVMIAGVAGEWHGIETGPAEGTATTEPPDGQPATASGAMHRNRLMPVLGARRKEPTG